MAYELTQSQTSEPIVFLMVDSALHIPGKTGLAPTVTISKNGGAFGSPSGAVTEIANGWYKIAPDATDTDTLGPLIVHAEAAGADPVDLLFQVVKQNRRTASMDLVLAKTTNITGLNDILATAVVSSGAITTNGGAVSNVTSVDTVASVTGNVGGNVVGSVGSVAGAVGSVTSPVTAGTVSDKTGYSLTGTLTTLDALWAKIQKWLRLALRKDAAVATDHATELAEINANGGSGAGAYANTTDSQEAIRDASGIDVTLAATQPAITWAQQKIAANVVGEGALDITNASGTGNGVQVSGGAYGTYVEGGTGMFIGANTGIAVRIDGVTYGVRVIGTNELVNGLTSDITGSLSGSVASVSNPVTAGTVSDKTGYSLTGTLTTLDLLWGKIQKWLRLAFRKDAAIAINHVTELNEINANQGGGAGTYANTTDSLEALRDAASTLDAAGIRSAVGLASANLDTQLAGLPTDQDVRDAMKLAPTAGSPATGSIDKHLDDLLSGALTAQQVRDAMKLAPTAGSPAAGSVDDHLDDLATALAEATTNVTVVSAVDGGTLTLYQAVRFSATLTGLSIPASWTAMLWTVKTHTSQADTKATLQILKSNPADSEEDGLVYLNGAAGTLVDGTLTVDQPNGTVTIWASDAATSELSIMAGLPWSIKALVDTDNDSRLVATGTLTILDQATAIIEL